MKSTAEKLRGIKRSLIIATVGMMCSLISAGFAERLGQLTHPVAVIVLHVGLALVWGNYMGKVFADIHPWNWQGEINAFPEHNDDSAIS